MNLAIQLQAQYFPIFFCTLYFLEAMTYNYPLIFVYHKYMILLDVMPSAVNNSGCLHMYPSFRKYM